MAPLVGIRKAAGDFLASVRGGQAGTSGMSAVDREVARLNAATNRADVQFGPGDAPAAQPLDQSGLPRRNQYRVGWNIPSLPGEGRPLPFQTLKDLTDAWWVLSKGIEVRADQLLALNFDVTARDADKKAAKAVLDKRQGQIAAIRAFFDRPDRKHTRQVWMRRLLRDHLVYDAVSIYKRRTLGGKLHSLRLLDGSTIKPLLDIQGETPDPPQAAYQQYLDGVPRDTFTTDELIYAVRAPRNDSPYGRSAVEQFMWEINKALRFDRAVLDRYTDGSLPTGLATPPPGTTPAQLDDLRAWWASVMEGDTRAMWRLQWVPAGTKVEVLKELTGFDEPFARWLVRVGCSAIGITPQELGFPEQESLGGKGFSEEQSAIQRRKNIYPLARWLCDEIFNPLIWNDFGCPDLQAVFVPEGDEEDQLQALQAREIAIRSGQLSIDQVVEEDGGSPPGIGRIFVVGNNILFEPDLVLGSKEGAHAVAGVEMDTPGEGEKPPSAPKPGTPGSNDVTGASANPPLAQGQQQSKPSANARQSAPNTANAGKSVADEVETFLRLLKERRKAGKGWREFRSDVLPGETLAALNKAAAAGAEPDELRALVGLESQPAAFKARVATTERGYRDLTRQLAERMARELEGAA